MDGFEIEGEEVDVAGFLRGGSAVFEEAADCDVEMVFATGLVGNFKKGQIIFHCFVGIGEEYNAVVCQGG